MNKNRIRVGIMADGLGRKGMGTAVVLEELVREYTTTFKDEVEVVLLYREGECTHALCESTESVKIRIINLPKYRGFFSYLWFFIFTKEKFDIIHFPRPSFHPFFWLLKVFGKTKKIVATFHGAPESKDIPIFETGMNRFNRTMIMHWGQYFIDGVIADSDSAVEPIASYYKIPMKKITGILLATKRSPRKQERSDDEEKQRLEEKYGIRFPYILSVGRLDPHKNVHRMVEAFANLKKTQNTQHQLVIVGGRHEPEYSKKVDAMIKKDNLENEIYIAPFIEEEDLPLLYQHADFFVFVSLSEGFGLPLLEAMQNGTPIITSSVSAMPEVTDGAAMTVNPWSVEEIQDAIKTLLTDNRKREELREKGFERLKDFSWQKTAEETYGVYKTVLGK
ncbi:MAG: hypothetical protein COU08_02500 [Candidatus Harrisonbacteria bacterium CG10_big_fil_rev_8_21_14_0_10_42_17]|uniref:Glycosyltransferase family 1 protein n=1 Tax=Candidatus Harrisonbacteria bacterium CG10_big_fil_rev_8_21_14_0_10_42_17 TaxID=1974584 RepID=A0A2M6WI22_9BACT|nr:MAG: hypothetical protein COU08_02500 [Candidatus Harrisonbacteria bacterium CG10_big_fil_rev_8_21_14_0_10_42_17]